jgi:hypothetical protein
MALFQGLFGAQFILIEAEGYLKMPIAGIVEKQISGILDE